MMSRRKRVGIDWFRTLFAYPSDLWKDRGLIYTIQDLSQPPHYSSGNLPGDAHTTMGFRSYVAGILTHPPICFLIISGDPPGHLHDI